MDAFLVYQILNASVYNKCIRNSIPFFLPFFHEQLSQATRKSEHLHGGTSRATDRTDTMELFCWIIDKSIKPFAVDIANDDTMYDR